MSWNIQSNQPSGEEGENIYGILFRAEVKPGKRQEFVDHAKWVVEVAKKEEPATLRFDWYVDPNDENAFCVYEAYENEAGFEAHKQNKPYKSWASGRAEELTSSVEPLFYGAHTMSTTGE